MNNNANQQSAENTINKSENMDEKTIQKTSVEVLLNEQEYQINSLREINNRLAHMNSRINGKANCGEIESESEQESDSLLSKIDFNNQKIIGIIDEVKDLLTVIERFV